MPDKTEAALKTIGETAEIVGVTREQLRTWQDQFPRYVRPITRAGGHRLYRPELIQLLMGIKYLYHVEHYTREGVQRVLKLYGVNHVRQIHVNGDESYGRSGCSDGDNLEQVLQDLQAHLFRASEYLTSTHSD